MKVAVLVGVEEYAAADMADVRFARNDAEALSEAWAAVGFDGADQTVLVNGLATKAAVESALRAAIGRLGGGDSFYLYYAGHGFCGGARNFLTCHDTEATDLMATSIELEWVFGLLRESRCTRVALFLDSCRGEGLGSDLFGDRADSELEAFFTADEGRVCFASSQSGQVSWASRRNKRGAWALNVVEAFRGNAPAALMNGVLLTSESLQEHLGAAVQETLAGDFVERRDQSPWACGSECFELAHLGPILHAREASKVPSEAQVPRLAFCGETSVPIKKLSGFKKHQRVPTELSHYAEGLAREAAREELDAELERIYRRLRDEFDLRRKDLSKVGPEDGAGSIDCPFFTYHLHVAQDPADPSRVVYYREVGDITEPERILDRAFLNAFGGTFRSLRFTPPLQLDLDQFIDRMEALGDQLQSLDFDPAGTFCKVRIRGVEALINVTVREIVLTHDTSSDPRVLIESFTQSQQLLGDTSDVPLIAFGS